MSKSKKNTDLNLLVLASRQLTGPEGMPVEFAFRTESSDAGDSGWNFWSGKESREFINNSANFVRYPLEQFIKLDQSLSEIIDAEIGSCWEKDSETGSWIEVQE